MDTLELFRNFLRNTPKEEIIKEWKEIEAMGIESPNAFDYLAGLSVYYNQGPPPINIETSELMTSNFSGSFFFHNLAL